MGESTQTSSESAELGPHKNHVLARMGYKDVLANARLDSIMQLVHKLSDATEPTQVASLLARLFRDELPPHTLVSISTRDLEPGEYIVTRWITPDGVNRVPTNNPWFEKDKLKKYSCGFIAQAIWQDVPKLALHLNIPDDPDHGKDLASFGSMIAVPTFTNGQAKNWVLMFRDDPEGFTMQDLERVLMRSNLVGAMVGNILGNKRLRELNDQLHAEMKRIAAIQKALLPAAMPDIPGMTFATSYQTYDTAGGDMYDWRPLTRTSDGKHDPTGLWAILIADVSGHGPSAAVVMAMLHSILQTFPYQPKGPGEVLEYANRHLCDKRIEESFVTATLLFYDPKTRELSYARAGHPPAIVKSPSNCGGPATLRLDAVGDLPLGVMDEATYENASLILQPGQTVILYTDGITEATAPSGKMFDYEGIERALHSCTGEPDCIIAWIDTVLRRHEAGMKPNDDQTIVAFQITE